MVRLKAKRTALLLYSVLLVLPAVVLGALHWHKLWLDYQAELDAVPESARDAARRLADGIAQHLDQLLDAEEGRPFHHYAEIVAPEDPIGVEPSFYRSPLLRDPRPPGVLAWFGYDLAEGYDAEVDLFHGRSAEPDEVPAEARSPVLSAAARELLLRNLEDGFLRRAARLRAVTTTDVPLLVAALHAGQPERVACLREHAAELADATVPVGRTQLHLRFYFDGSGTPRALATRRVLLAEIDAGLVERYPCLEPLEGGFDLVQGLFLDPYWLFEELPVWVSDRVLSGSERFQDDPRSREGGDGSAFRFPVSLVRVLGFEVRTDDGGQEPGEFGQVDVVIDKGEIESRFEAHMWRFLGVAGMLALTLGTGIVLLLRSVTRELEQAAQTENFVAAVTHELRTPLSTIRLHGEMLLEGWVHDEEKRGEYYDRIVRETSRLSTLVERVLEKARLSAGSAPPERGDVNALVERQYPGLAHRGGGDGADLVLHLDPRLPDALVSPEGLTAILENLVENARKYAGASREDPIEIETRAAGGEVLLEVRDRGPGIPAEEASRVFEAFYRVGNESTRTSTGTGLGLHLVALHAEAMGGRATVHSRTGGGAIFRIHLQKA